jgi:uridine kinase
MKTITVRFKAGKSPIVAVKGVAGSGCAGLIDKFKAHLGAKSIAASNTDEFYAVSQVTNQEQQQCH